MNPRAGYRAERSAVLRVPALSVQEYLEALTGDHAGYLAAAWDRPEVADAVREAAPDLARALDTGLSSTPDSAAAALDRYLNRMSTRPTPFGRLAGVVGIPVGPGADPVLTGPLRPASAAPRTPAPARTGLVRSDLVHACHGRLWREPSGPRESARQLSPSTPVEAVLALAAEPVGRDELTAKLCARLGTDDLPAARALVDRLHRLGFLRATDPAAQPDQRASLAALDPASALDPRFARLAAQAAELLAAVGRGSAYPERMRRQAAAFTRHFGAEAWVPALETARLLDLLPAAPLAAPGPRDALLATLATTALTRRALEVELDDALLDRLRDGDQRPPLPGAEIVLRAARIPDGPLAVLSGPAAVPAGTVHGRFAGLLDPRTSADLAAAAEAERAAAPGRLLAELVHLPTAVRARPLGARTARHPDQLLVDAEPLPGADARIRLADVRVGVEDGRFALRLAPGGEPLHLVQSSSLSLSLAAPVVAFLLDVSVNQFRHPAPFDWGWAERLPFLPRLRRGALVLAPARWRLDRAALTDRPERHWLLPRHVHLVQDGGRLLLDLRSPVSRAHLARALDRAGDGTVVLEETLPLPGGELLHDREGRAWTCEAVVPVTTAVPAPVRQQVLSVRGLAHEVHHPGGTWLSLHLDLPRGDHDRLITRHLPELAGLLRGRHGSDTLFFVRYADPLPQLRIRMRPGAGTRLPRGVLDDVLDWVHGLDGRLPVLGVGLHDYRPETDRYGGPGLIASAEALFCADSRAVAGLLSGPAPVLARLLLTALTLDRLGALLLPDLTERRALCRELVDSRSGAEAYRRHGRELMAARAHPALDTASAHWAAAVADFPRAPAPRVAAALLHLHANRMGLDRAQERAALGCWSRLLAHDAHAAPAAPPFAPPSPSPRNEVAS